MRYRRCQSTSVVQNVLRSRQEDFGEPQWSESVEREGETPTVDGPGEDSRHRESHLPMSERGLRVDVREFKLSTLGRERSRTRSSKKGFY